MTDQTLAALRLMRGTRTAHRIRHDGLTTAARIRELRAMIACPNTSPLRLQAAREEIEALTGKDGE